jgi:hypothetical protein
MRLPKDKLQYKIVAVDDSVKDKTLSRAITRAFAAIKNGCRVIG